MSDIDTLLAEYRQLAKANTKAKAKAAEAAARRSAILQELTRHLNYVDIGRLVDLSAERVRQLATRQ